MDLASLHLKKSEERRLRNGHLWIYSNEVDTKHSPLNGFQPGQQVRVVASSGKPLGVAYVNPHSLICGRLVSRSVDQLLDQSLLIQRNRTALALRERLFDNPFYRLVYGDSDLLPGLVVDRFGDVLVAQLNTAGMEVLRDEVIDALQSVLNPTSILLRNDNSIRTQEGL